MVWNGDISARCRGVTCTEYTVLSAIMLMSVIIFVNLFNPNPFELVSAQNTALSENKGGGTTSDTIDYEGRNVDSSGLIFFK